MIAKLNSKKLTVIKETTTSLGRFGKFVNTVPSHLLDDLLADDPALASFRPPDCRPMLLVVCFTCVYIYVYLVFVSSCHTSAMSTEKTEGVFSRLTSAAIALHCLGYSM